MLPKVLVCVGRKNLLRTICSNKAYSTSTSKDEIVIPKRIPRGPTDILRALESTIKQDPTAAHYKYHDDPYLIPMSNLGKRTFAMAQEAGRKAAHWVRQQHPDLFQHREADPTIQAYVPKQMYTETSEVIEEDLIRVIKDGFVTDAQVVYKILKDKGVAIASKTQLDLLELLCYYNHEDCIPEEFIEERWFKQGTSGKERQRKTWKDGLLAEEIFISFDNPNEEVYSAIIQGMVKYYQVDKGWQLFQDAQEKGFVLSVEVYNSLISVSSFLKESYDLRWNFVVDMLSSMSKAQVKPNLGTLNAVLSTLSAMGTGRMVKMNVLKTLAEFEGLGVKPSLASWYYVLITYCKERGPRSLILTEILNELEGKELKICDLKDTFFFVTAMDICHYHLRDKDLAKRVHKLLLHKNNYNLIGDSYKESIYYRHYLTLLCISEPLHEFMENVYQTLVPHIYVPEPSVMLEILNSVEASGAVEYLPKLFSDMIIFDHTSRERLLTVVLNIMTTNIPETPDLMQKFSNIAWDIYNKIENQNENRTQVIQFTGEMLGKIMFALLKNKDFTKACTVMDKLDKNQQKILGVPSFESLSLFVENCIEQKLPSRAISCIRYTADGGYEDASKLAVTLQKALTLDEMHLSDLAKIVGIDVLKNTQSQDSQT